MKGDIDRHEIVVSNPWSELRTATPARIALGRAGISLPSRPHLQFQLDHARARSAVHRALDIKSLRDILGGYSTEWIPLDTRAPDRVTYLQRPDDGRRLSDAARERVAAATTTAGYDVALVVADGLSALAVEVQVPIFVEAVIPMIANEKWSLAPICVVSQARVAVGDEIGQLLGARLVVVLIGERPGLSSPDSLGIYMTLYPRIGLTDDSRNCISNVRAAGLPPRSAARKLVYLMREAMGRDVSGVALKDEEAVSSENHQQISRQTAK